MVASAELPELTQEQNDALQAGFWEFQEVNRNHLASSPEHGVSPMLEFCDHLVVRVPCLSDLTGAYARRWFTLVVRRPGFCPESADKLTTAMAAVMSPRQRLQAARELQGQLSTQMLSNTAIVLAPMPAAFVRDLSEGELVKRAMGGNCDPCIFEHNDSDVKQVQILALYPPSGSVPSQEHNNRTSLEIAKLLHGYHFQWNDLVVVSLMSTRQWDQALLMQLLLSGRCDHSQVSVFFLSCILLNQPLNRRSNGTTTHIADPVYNALRPLFT